jgi:hypothetical protein
MMPVGLNMEFLKIKPNRSISAIKSCIEADEPILLLDMIRDNYEAKIFALTCCFTFIPSVKCIEHLIAAGTPLDKTFDNNPFNCTPQEYLDKHFSFRNNSTHSKARTSIYNSIENGKLHLKNNEHIAININTVQPEIKQSTVKKIGKLLSSITKH